MKLSPPVCNPDNSILDPDDASLKRVEAIRSEYTIVITPFGTSKFKAYAREFEGVTAVADAQDQCLTKLNFMLDTVILSLLDDGNDLPRPLSSARRTQQINIRLSPAEKLRLEEEALQKGFAGISALVRTKALASG